MKKLIKFGMLIICFLILTVFPFKCFAADTSYSINELNLKIDIPSNMYTITRESLPIDEVFNFVNSDYEAVMHDLEKDDVYLISYSSDFSYKLTLSMIETKQSKNYHDFNTLSENELNSLIESFTSEKTCKECSVYKINDAKYLYILLEHTNGDGAKIAVAQYSTVINGQQITLQIIGNKEALSETESTALNNIIRTIKFTTITEKPNTGFVFIILFLAIALFIVSILAILIASFIRHRKNKANDFSVNNKKLKKTLVYDFSAKAEHNYFNKDSLFESNQIKPANNIVELNSEETVPNNESFISTVENKNEVPSEQIKETLTNENLLVSEENDSEPILEQSEEPENNLPKDSYPLKEMYQDNEDEDEEINVASLVIINEIDDFTQNKSESHLDDNSVSANENSDDSIKYVDEYIDTFKEIYVDDFVDEYIDEYVDDFEIEYINEYVNLNEESLYEEDLVITVCNYNQFTDMSGKVIPFDGANYESGKFSIQVKPKQKLITKEIKRPVKRLVKKLVRKPVKKLVKQPVRKLIRTAYQNGMRLYSEEISEEDLNAIQNTANVIDSKKISEIEINETIIEKDFNDNDINSEYLNTQESLMLPNGTNEEVYNETKAKKSGKTKSARKKVKGLIGNVFIGSAFGVIYLFSLIFNKGKPDDKK